MGLPTNNKNNKQGSKNQKANNSQSKFIPKPGKAAGAVVKKANRTGGTRGS